MTKGLDEQAMTEELSSSAFFKPTTSPSLDPPPSSPSSRVTESPQRVDAPGSGQFPSEMPPVIEPSHETPLPRPERTNDPSNEGSIERSNVRKKVRHTFDVRSDHLLSLRKIAVEREDKFGKRVLLGDLVQEALDLLISRERNKD